MTRQQRRNAALKGWVTRRRDAAFRVSPMGRMFAPGLVREWMAETERMCKVLFENPESPVCDPRWILE